MKAYNMTEGRKSKGAAHKDKGELIPTGERYIDE